MATTESRQPPEPDSVTLRGTQRGLEVEIPPGHEADQILEALRDKLEESPQFFAGNDVILRFLGDVAAGSLGALEALCAEFELSIVGIRSPREERRKAARAALAVVDELAVGSGVVIQPPPLLPEPEPEPEPEPASFAVPVPVPASAPAPAPETEPAPTARFVRGPIRSGVVLESDQHLVILGDVNPGAEVRSLGGIAVLGRLRGIAHAGAGEPTGADGFILALELAPQQLRVGELVARAKDAETGPGRAEIAYAKDQQIIVETFRGALPRPLWGLVS